MYQVYEKFAGWITRLGFAVTYLSKRFHKTSRYVRDRQIRERYNHDGF